jgi:hypothetical protein
MLFCAKKLAAHSSVLLYPDAIAKENKNPKISKKHIFFFILLWLLLLKSHFTRYSILSIYTVHKKSIFFIQHFFHTKKKSLLNIQ